MNKNVGGFDRIARIAVGLALIVASLTGVIGWWGLIGVVPLATGFMRFCPAYLPFGLSTCAKT
jgi:hypothetical protein